MAGPTGFVAAALQAPREAARAMGSANTNQVVAHPRRVNAVPPWRLNQDGLAHHRAGRLDLAGQCYRDALAIEPNDVTALHLLGVLRHQQGASIEAQQLIARAVSINPNDAAARVNLAVVLEALGKLDEAIDATDQALLLAPHNVEAWSNRANVLLKLARYEDAVASYSSALALAPQKAEALNNRGAALSQLRRFEEALTSFDNALAIRPAYAEAHNNRGGALLRLGEPGQALASFEEALALAPSYAEALFNSGNALAELARYSEAVARYDRALAILPNYAKAFNNRGKTLIDQGRVDAALSSYAQAASIQPDFAEARSNVLFAQQYLDTVTNAEIAASSRAFGEAFKTRHQPKRFTNDRTVGRRLRVGYVSADFRVHPVGFLIAKVLEAHDRTTVDVVCYSNGVGADAMTDRLRAAADGWRDVAGLADDDVEAMILADRVDVLVDLSGHTAGNRLPMFARRVAPVQASWLGYPGTTGVGAMDYLITDESAVPASEVHLQTEAVVRLPTGRFCYAPPDYAPAPVDPPSLALGFVTFGSFNNIAKISPAAVALWAEVLAAVPRSRLVIKWKSFADEAVRQSLTERFLAVGVSAERLELRGFSPHEELLGEYGEIDIALDPFPFSGGMTSLEALWMGVPVLTLHGERSASRHLSQQFKYLELDDCVARSPRDYVERAVALASDPSRLASLRAALRPRMAASALCDGPLFAAGLERSFREMWRRWCIGEPAASFDVAGRLGSEAAAA